MNGTRKGFIIVLALVAGLVVIWPHDTYAEMPGDNWLRMTRSQRVNYLVGYVQGVDTGIDVALDYRGTVFEDLLYSSHKLRMAILNRVTELYEKRVNRVIDWKSMLLVACMELEGESKDIVEQRLIMMRDMLRQQFGQNYTRAGDYWLKLQQSDRSMYLGGLIEGIRTGITLEEQQDSRTKSLFMGLFDTGSKIASVADIVTDFYKDSENRIIDYRFLFPLAFMKYSKVEESFIRKQLEHIRNTEKERR